MLKRFEAYGWDTQEVADGNDVDAIQAAIAAAKKSDKPSIIKIETKIGYGAPNKQGKASAHGEPLGEEEIKLTKGKPGLALCRQGILCSRRGEGARCGNHGRGCKGRGRME